MGQRHFKRAASKDNDLTTINAIGDYSVTPASFRVAPEDTDTVEIHRMIVSISAATINNADGYGGIAALTNGIHVYIKNASGLIEEMTGFPIKTNGEWAAHCHDVVFHDGFSSGDDWMTCRWTFSASGAPIVLSDKDEQYLEIYLNDDFSGLTTHRFKIQGHYTSRTY